MRANAKVMGIDAGTVSIELIFAFVGRVGLLILGSTLAALAQSRDYVAITCQSLASTSPFGDVMHEDAKKINPMELRDLPHVRRIDDSGFISDLYGRKKCQDGQRSERPGVCREQEQKREAVVAAVKAGGHPMG